MPDIVPEFPVTLVWYETGEIEEFDDKVDLLCNLESFDTRSDGHEAIVKDARGRLVHLRGDSTTDTVEVRFVGAGTTAGADRRD